MQFLILLISIVILQAEPVQLTINITPPAEAAATETPAQEPAAEAAATEAEQNTQEAEQNTQEATQNTHTATQGAAGFTAEEIDLLARTVQAEAGGEDETGKRLVAAVILNRMQSGLQDFKSQTTVAEVVGAPGQFVTAGWASAEAYDAVYKEIAERSNTEVLWFAAGGFQPYGTPLFQHGGHFFSGQ